MVEMMVEMKQQPTKFISWSKNQSCQFLTEFNLIRNYPRRNHFYADECIHRLWEVLLQHETEDHLKAKGLSKGLQWVEILGDEGYAQGRFRALRTPSIASLEYLVDQFDVEYVDEADASYIPQDQAAPSEADAPPPPEAEAPATAPTAQPTASPHVAWDTA